MVVTVGLTVTEVLETVPTPLLMDVLLALATVHERTVELPTAIEAGVAVNEEMVGAPTDTVAEHVELATVDEASVTTIV